MATYHVTCGINKKLVTVEHKNLIRQAIYDVFRKMPTLIQYYSEEYDDWIDVEYTNDIPDGVKKLLFYTRTLERKSSIPSTPDGGNNTKSFQINTTCGLPEIEDLPALPENSDWHSVYRFPNFPSHVLSHLSELKPNEIVKGKVRREIMNLLFMSMRCISPYPAQYQYRDVCNLLIRKYPMLKDSPANGKCAYASWLKGIRQKFKDWRRSLPDDPYHNKMRKKYGRMKNIKVEQSKNSSDCEKGDGSTEVSQQSDNGTKTGEILNCSIEEIKESVEGGSSDKLQTFLSML